MSGRLRDDLVHAALTGALATGGRLPLGLTRAAGPLVIRPLLWMLRRERARMRRHLEIALPELEPSQRRRLLRGCASHFGRQLAEVAWLLRARPEDVERLCDLEGEEHVFDALADGRGVMMATAHCGNWELYNARIAVAGMRMSIAVRDLKDPRLDRIATDLRTRFGTEVVTRGRSAGRELMRALERNRTVGLLIDQDIPSIPGAFVPFFGRDAWTPTGAAMLALRMRCPMVTGFIHRRPDGTHVAKIGPPLPAPEEGELDDRVRQLTAAATAAVEWQVRAWPEQWVWMHRRWRTRPQDEVVCTRRPDRRLAAEPDRLPLQRTFF